MSATEFMEIMKLHTAEVYLSAGLLPQYEWTCRLCGEIRPLNMAHPHYMVLPCVDGLLYLPVCTACVVIQMKEARKACAPRIAAA